MAALAELGVLVVDFQTTGATPALGALLEVGWTLVRPSESPGQIEAHRVALPKGSRIPRVVRELTGIHDSVHEAAIEPEEVWRRLRVAAKELAFAGAKGAVPTVIHYARFELAFLRDLHARFDPEEPFPFDIVCAHEIARRILPGLPRRSLRALAGYFGHGLNLARRSAGHVEATAFVWKHLAAELAERDVLVWEDLKAWLAKPAPPATDRRVYPLAREQRLALPDAPGVYRMLRPSGDVLYVGKATSLRKRVSSHFKKRGAGERALEMLSQTRDLDVTVTATVLEAALLETDEIKWHDPPYNVHLRESEREAWFASVDLATACPRPDAEHRVGPLPSRWAMSSLAAVRALAGGLEPTASLCARAVGVPRAFGPTQAEFSEGYRLFAERRLLPVRSRTPWGAILKASKALWRASKEGDEADRDPEAPRIWDPERVCRHLDRAILQGGQVLRRARWLCLLGDASVAWRDTGAATDRLLVIASGEIVEQRDLSPDEPPPVPPSASRTWRERQASFDAARYDRLRVLSTELKRVAAETGVVAVRLSERHLLQGALLDRLLRWV